MIKLIEMIVVENEDIFIGILEKNKINIENEEMKGEKKKFEEKKVKILSRNGDESNSENDKLVY